MTIRKWKDGRYWAVYDDSDALVVVALYRRGAEEVSRRLSLYPPEPELSTDRAHEATLPDRASPAARPSLMRF